MGGSLEGRIGVAHGYDEEIVVHSCKATIDRMKCEYLDLYQLHWPSRDIPIFGAHAFFPKGENRAFPYFDEGKPEDFERAVRRRTFARIMRF